MHPNPAFRDTATETALAFVRDAGFGLLVVNGEFEPLISHVPFTVSNMVVDLHLVRSNPIARLVNAPMPAKIAVTGPHSYISPDWYEVEDQVPTWNYVAVHLSGVLEPLPTEDLRSVLDTLSDEFEFRLSPKPNWTADKMSADALAKMMRMIQPFRFTVKDVQSTYKLSQNKPDSVRLAAVRKTATDGIGTDIETLSRMMSSLPPKDQT